MAKMRHGRRPGDEAYPGRFNKPSPERIQEMLAGPRTNHRGQTWHEQNGNWSHQDWEEYYNDWTPDREPMPGPPRLEWRDGPGNLLPHVRDEIDDYNSSYADTDNENSFHNSFWPAASQSTAIREHGETRYGLDVGDEGFDPAGWGWHWRLHKQTGPDADNPEHWEKIRNSPELITSDVMDNPEHAKLMAERALQQHIDRQQQSRPGIGDYDQQDFNKMMRDEGL